MENKKKRISFEMKKEVKNEQNETKISRRSFLKRSAYSAPVLIAMGQLAKPTRIHADSKPAGPPGTSSVSSRNRWNPN